MDFTGFDPMAEIRIEGVTLTISFRFTDEAEAIEAGQALVAAHARGEPVTITLSNPHQEMLQ